MERAVKGRGDRILQIVIIALLTLLMLAAILPFVLLVASSFSDEASLMKDGYGFWPRGFSLYAYQYLFVTNASTIFRAYGITFFITIVGTCLSLLIGPMLAWPLSRRDYPRAKAVTFVIFFTMLLNGGMVPSYIMWTNIFHIKNSIVSLILPNLVFNGFYIILYKNNFSSNIHPALVEAARLDGAGEFYIYRKIVLPLSLPILATVGLMVGIGYWNDWVNGLYYITDTRLYSLQVFLNNMMSNMRALVSLSSGIDVGIGDLPAISIRMAIAVVGTLPILILYPFFQKAFIAGIALGGVKE
ncbi:MAG: carbohydrate ABC transporter permease [Lachnospiraceae bacterium]|nr:carbohydrate ABC transporter permease [Lachnospiraceae bacterium]MCI9150533.1 carbohydrate ABC transporter permease [Lachnospiraceae bacterium]